MVKKKYVKVEMTLLIVEDDDVACQPVNQWLPNAVVRNLEDGEYIIDYHDTEAEWDAKWGTEPVGETADA
jgi:hypothetical protein